MDPPLGVGRRHYLRNKDARRLLKDLSDALKVDVSGFLDSDQRVEVAELSPRGEVFLVGGKPAFIRFGRDIFPTLLYERLLDLLPSLIVDMGAVPHVCNGADVMAPGVVDVCGEFDAGALVVVRDERHRRHIAVGRTLFGSDVIREKRRGKVAKNVHFVGDRLWEAIKLMG